MEVIQVSKKTADNATRHDMEVIQVFKKAADNATRRESCISLISIE